MIRKAGGARWIRWPYGPVALCAFCCCMLHLSFSRLIATRKREYQGSYAPHALSALELASVDYGAATPAQAEAPRVR